MSVKLLAGPFPLGTVTGETPVTMSTSAYYPNVGLLVSVNFGGSTVSQFQVCTLDGLFNYGRGLLDWFNMTWSWWPEKKRMLAVGVGHKEYVIEPHAFMYQGSGEPGPVDTGGTHYVRLPDRRIYVKQAGVYVYIDGLPDAVEATDFPDFDPAIIWPGRSEIEMFLSGSHNLLTFNFDTGAFYNTVTHALSSPLYVIGIPAYRLLYAPEYGVMISAHREDLWDAENVETIRIWSLEVEPAILSDITVFEGTVKSGQVVTYRVRVTGAQDDPAEGELVAWTLNGAGLLLDLQSAADAQGFATARVQYLVGETGLSVLEASVLC